MGIDESCLYHLQILIYIVKWWIVTEFTWDELRIVIVGFFKFFINLRDKACFVLK